MRKTLLITLLLAAAVEFTFAQSSGIKGKITDESGQDLPHATIYIRNLRTGTSSNIEGYFEYPVPPGKYDLVFKYIGYESQLKYVEVTNGYQEINIQLKSQSIMLKNVEIRAGKEDPAYTIIRKAIAKAKFHTQQIDKYSTRVYMKGSGRVIDVPFFLRKAMEKEGVDSTMAFTSESVSVIEYERPNKVTQRVIAVHSQGDDNDTGPEEFLTSSFYEPEVSGAISPLSPRAFSYYRFGWEGAFEDGDYLINKIRVTPRSRGDNVFEGTVYIVDQLWSIHSLDLNTTELGIKFRTRQLYSAIDDQAWMPINNKIDVSGTFFGVKFEYNYLATMSGYEVELNPDLKLEFTVIDEKIEKEEAKEASIEDLKQNDVLEELSTKKELTRKDLRKAMIEYEKMEQEETEFPDVISNVNTIRDSTTIYNNDSAYWSAIRSVPLTSYESKGYQKMEEFEEKEKEEAKKDSVKQRTIHIQDPIVGNSYKLSENDRLVIKSPLPTFSFNAVEGYHFDYEVYYRHTTKGDARLQFGPVLRYSFAREKLLGKFRGEYRFGDRLKRSSLEIESGKYISQFNTDEPIHPYINTFTALVLEENYMKIFEKQFTSVLFKVKPTKKLSVHASFEYQNRTMLSNNSTHAWFNRENKRFESNTPVNAELADTTFPDHRAVITTMKLSWEPWQKYKIVNGNKRPVDGSSPQFRMNYTKGISGLFDSDVDYDLLSVGMSHGFELGVRNRIDVRVEAGKFLNDESMTFADFKHFLGNQTPFSTTDPSKSYRLLDYYRYSTRDAYLTIHLHDQFRRLMITQLPLVRAMGIKENVFVNYLNTPESNHYTEIGYGLDNIFRVFRLETVTQWIDGSYEDIGFRIGIATNLDDLFN